MERAQEFKMRKPPMCTRRNMNLIKAGSGRSQILPAAIMTELSARQFRITSWMPGADEIHSPLWKEQQRLTGSQSAKNKSGLSRRWCAARAPSAVSLDASPFVHSFSDGGQQTAGAPADWLACGVVRSAVLWGVTHALAEVVNSSSVRH